MNFVDKFDTGLPHSGAGLHPKALPHVDSVSGHAPSGSVVVKDAHLLFNGDYKKAGLDLVISKDGQEVVVPEYFKGDKRAALASPDGAHLTGDIVSALAGHAQYAQTADGSASAAKVIGHVTKLAGNATVVRNGVSIVLNLGDTVNQGDVVQSGSSSTLGITFIDGSVFGLGSNARMVLNEMVYDPNGSNNSSLLSLVQGTISFVAGATAKHGDMKVDTPVATMGIRGTAVLVEIDFEIPGSGAAPPARFQVLVEPDGTTGSYVLLDKVTLSPIATVNQAGTQTTVSGQGLVTFLSSAQLSQEAQDVINKVFALKFTETNPNTTTRFSDIGVPENKFIQLANGQFVPVALFSTYLPNSANSGPQTSNPRAGDHIPGPPSVTTFDREFVEKVGLKASLVINGVSGGISYIDINVGDVPTVKTEFNSFVYRDANHQSVATLTAEQLAAIDAVKIPLQVTQDPAGQNKGTATWTYSIADGALDFLAEGEQLVLTYMAEVANNYPLNNERGYGSFTITITGTNDTPIIATTNSGFTELPGTANSAIDHAGGTISFEDVDLTDRPTVTTAFTSYTYQDRGGNDVTLSLNSEQKADIDAVKAVLTLTPASTNGHNGSVNWSYDVADARFDFLAVGEKLTLTYTATVDDHHGGTATVPVTVTITGTNDVPTIATSGDSITERIGTGNTAVNVAQGTVTFTDVDLTDRPVVTTSFGSFQYLDENGNDVTATLTAEQLAAISEVDIDLIVTQTAGNGNYGTATWVYSLVDSKFDFLAEDETLILTYVAHVDDGHGGFVSTPITVSVNGADVAVGGTNDLPVVNTTDNAFTELAGTTGSTANDEVAGSITFTDPDLTDTHSVTILSVAASGVTSGLAANGTVLGWLSLGTLIDSTNGATGSRPWIFKAPDNNFDYLADGEVLTLTYTIEVNDHHGGVVTKPVHVTVTGTNDTPVVSTTNGAFTEASNANQPNPTGSAALDTVTGSISFTDVDLSDTHSVTIESVSADGVTSGLAANATVLGWLSLGTLTDSTGGVNGSRPWTFKAADQNFDYLADGEQLTLTYTIKVDDYHGGVVTKEVTITVTGTNDTPVVSTTNGAFTEASNADQPNPTGSTTLDTVTGSIGFTDVDLSDTHSVTIESVSADGVTSGLAANATVLGWLSLGTLADTVNGVNGSRPWTFEAADQNFDYLADGEQLTLTYTIKVDDGHGGVVTKPVTITVTGTNDTPVVTSGGQDATLYELTDTHGSASLQTASGSVTFTDVDHSDTHSVEITGVSITGVDTGAPDEATVLEWLKLGAFTDSGNGAGSRAWDFSAQDHYFDYLADGEQLLLSYTIEIADLNGGVITQTVNITITGSNDAPAVEATNGSLHELLDMTGSSAIDTIGGTITFSDVDLTDRPAASADFASFTYTDASQDPVTLTADQQAAVAAVEATLTVTPAPGNINDGSATWTYSIDDSALDFLAEDDILTLTYTATVDDGLISVATPFTVTIAGTNDRPVVAAALTDSAHEGDAAFTRDLLDGASDVDRSETATLSVTNLSFEVDNGGVSSTAPSGISLGADGHTLTIDPSNPAFDYLADDEQTVITVSYDVTDVHGATVHQTETITIDGINDAPSIVGETNPPVHGLMVVNPVSVTIEPAGQNTDSLGPNPETFDTRTAGWVSNNGAGKGDFTNSALGATFDGSGNAGVVQGSSSVSAAPFMGPLPGSQDTTQYLSIGAGGTETITFTTPKNAFGLYWGSIDSYNTIKFYDGTTLVASYTGADVSPLLANGNQGSFASNGYVEFVSLHNFNKVVLGTGNSNAFEIDNISAGTVAAPHVQLASEVSGTLSGHDPDIGDTLTGSVTASASVLYNNSTTLPNGVNVSDLIKASNITFDSVQSDGGTDVLHWNYDPHGANLDFLHAGDVLKLSYTAQVTDGHGSHGNQQLTITLVGANNNTDVSTLPVVDGTSGNDTFNNVGGNTTVFGNGGHDTFVFKPGFGSATITDFDAGNDTIHISSALFSSISAILAAAAPANLGHDTIITDAAHDTIILKNVTVAQLHASNFHLI